MIRDLKKEHGHNGNITALADKRAAVNGVRERLPKSVERFLDKRRGENKGLEQESDAKIATDALERLPKSVERFSGLKLRQKQKDETQISDSIESHSALGRQKHQREHLHEAVLEAACAAGGQYGEKGLVSYLEAQALKAPSPFLTLLGKVLGQAGEKEPPQITRIELVAPTPNPADSTNCPEPDG